MIVCPNCKHQEFDGALFCSDCGAQLAGAPPPVTQNIQRFPTGQMQSSPLAVPLPTTPLEAPVSLYVMDAGRVLPLLGRQEFTLGRSSEGQTVVPDLDLSDFQAYEKGVSRMHASVKVVSSPLTVAITDLGSVNGTRINGQRINPNRAMPLNHGDIITLGKLKLQLIIRR
jgi:pSer/pThr/pTyr-binding forkhead associated (FHA) protein